MTWPFKYTLEKRGAAWVVVYHDGGCHPASAVEIDLWLRVQRLESALKEAGSKTPSGFMRATRILQDARAVCTACNGTGWVPSMTCCPACHGTGRAPAPESRVEPKETDYRSAY